ncbi:hypothetical protein [Caballeronia cordobensis]|uniref:Lipoprotein n=1 Tax=Caballeronia cordobensis TaxID=1353886 RepID=A0A158GKU1_CABCO|nr:hypothetical protein BYI23_D011470 [Burkholderia sp. YI23]AQH03623.1 hypothetical protein A9R05_31850 [Burkholderia sp. KK1]BAO91173.1 uncharacterized protein BRPE67_DCDS00180 [Burkholderia sp. RPE67]SAL32497.1 hypothetical protein AWB70_02148 [Caballeronia cordobensis]
MNRLKVFIALSLAASACVAANAHAWARVGVWVGGPVYYPYAVAPAPYYYYSPPPVMVAPQAPVQYVEQGQPAVEPGAPLQETGMWYYCDAAKAYYPYVKHCAGAWRPVPATPPSN